MSVKGISRILSVFLFVLVSIHVIIILRANFLEPLFNPNSAIGRIERDENHTLISILIISLAGLIFSPIFKQRLTLLVLGSVLLLLSIVDLWFWATFYGLLQAFGYIAIGRSYVLASSEKI